MDPKDRFIKDKPTGKVRVVHGGRHRGKPYSRAKTKESGVNNVARVDEKSFMGKVASYVVPQWLTSWFGGKKEELSDHSDIGSENDDEEDDDEQQLDKDKQTEPSSSANTYVTSSNHVDQNIQPKTMTSTPVVKNIPFTILSSAVIDPQEGSSKDCHDDNSLEGNVNVIVKRSASKLLSIDEDVSGDEHDRVTGGIIREGNDDKTETFPKTRYTFSSDSQPFGAPQKFFTTQQKPSFKVSSFVSSSPLIPCGSSSSFYPGRTSYGGTSSLQSRNVKRQKMSPVASNVPRKTSNIRPKAFSSARGAVTSDTARKILGALDRMSSPVKDASKLPNSPSSVLFKPQRRKADQSFSLFSSQPNISMPPTNSLNMPHSVRIQFRGKANEPFKFGTGDIRPSAPVKTFKSHGLPMAFSPDDEYKGGGKMKRQRQTSHYSAAELKNVVEAPVNTLPEIHAAAPLLVSSLPKFDFGVTASKPKQAKSKVSAVESKTEINTNQKDLCGFTFSQPEIKLDSLQKNAKSIPKASYQFSQPTMKEKENENREEAIQKDSELIDLTKNSNTEGPLEKSVAEEFVPPKNQSGDDSVDISSSSNRTEAMKSLSETCRKEGASGDRDSNMSANKGNKKESIAFGSKGSPEVTKSKSFDKTSSLKAKFGMKEGSWDCDVCMLQNQATATECISCQTPKPGASAAPKSVQFSFGTSGQKSNIMFGTDGTSNSIKFGTNSGVNVTGESIFKTSGMGGFSFVDSSKSSGFNNETTEKTPNIKFGTSSSSDFVFGSSQAQPGSTFGTTVSFQTPKDNKVDSANLTVSSSRTEENNNISGSSVIFASPVQKPNDAQPASPSKNIGKDKTGKEEITSIADAARAGLLKVPEIDKTGSGANIVNGPTSVLNFSAPKSLKPVSNANEDKLVLSSRTSSSSNSFTFSAGSSEKDKKLFTFAKPIVSQGQTPTTVGFGVGSSHVFSFKPADDKLSLQSANQKKELPSFDNLNSSTGTDMPATFNFGSKSTFAFSPEGHSLSQSTSQPKNSTPATFNISTAVTSNAPSPFTFDQVSAPPTSKSLFQTPVESTENKVNSSTSFQFSAGPSKPISSIFSQRSMTEENTPRSSMPTERNLFTSAESSKDATKNIFGGSVVQNNLSFIPPSNMNNVSSTLSGGKFSFGTNSSNLSNIFGAQQPQKGEPGSSSGFGVTAATPVDIFKTVGSTDDKLKPVNSMEPSSGTQGSGLFNFSTTTTGTSGGFNFGTGGTANTMFSSGMGPSGPSSNRPIKRAVRRKK